MVKLNIVMYHYVRDLSHSRYPGIKGLDTDLFKEQITYLKKKFTIVKMEDIIDITTRVGCLPDNCALLTFDDGYIDNFITVLPILKQYKLQGSFFIPGKTFTEDILLDVNKVHFILASAPEREVVQDLLSLLDKYRDIYPEISSNDELLKKYAVANRFDTAETIFCKRILQTAIPEELRNKISSILFEKYVGLPENYFARELYMNRDQIRFMRDEGMFIGLHGYDHYWLANLSEDKMKKDIDKALEVMDEFIDKDNWVMNYPYGNYNHNVIEYIKTKGCKLGLTTEVGRANLEKDDLYQLPRWDCNDFPPKSYNYMKLEKI